MAGEVDREPVEVVAEANAIAHDAQVAAFLAVGWLVSQVFCATVLGTSDVGLPERGLLAVLGGVAFAAGMIPAFKQTTTPDGETKTTFLDAGTNPPNGVAVE